MMHVVDVSNIVKTYAGSSGTIQALNNISLTVNSGELFGLIGPDGSGKTSLFRILTTLLIPDGGSASVEGYDVVRDYKIIRNRIGYMPGKFSLYQDLTVEENLKFFATIFNTTIEENYNLVKDIYVQIEPFKNRRAGKLSGGMKQKLALCCALIHKPTVLFLDEPTTGVDPVSRKEFWNMLKNLQKQGITIIVSTPYMDEARLCDRIGFIQNGKLLTVDTPSAIIHGFSKKLFAVKAGDMYKLLLNLRDFNMTDTCFAFGDYHHVTMKNDESEKLLLDHLHQSGINDAVVKEIEPTIEDSFMEMIK